MKKLFFGMLVAAAAIIGFVPSQNLSADDKPIYGSFYTTETGTSILAGGHVPFELVTASSHGVEISGGDIAILHTGDYLVTYATAVSSPAEFQLFLNGVFIPGTQQTQGPDLYHPFSTIIRVVETHSVLSVIAVTATDLSNTEAGDTTAYLTILKVSE